MAEPTVLMIDDDPDTLILQEVVLKGAGLDVLTADSADKAFELISSYPNIELVLLDYEMGGMNGSHFIEDLEKREPSFFKKVPIVFVSAHRHLPETKAAGHIRKGMDIDDFAAAVKSYLPSK